VHPHRRAESAGCRRFAGHDAALLPRGTFRAYDTHAEMLRAGHAFNTTTPGAAWFAAAVLGCTEVHLYGADMGGTHHYDGTPMGPLDNQDRWAAERAEIIAVAASTGAAVYRHHAGGCERMPSLV